MKWKRKVSVSLAGTGVLLLGYVAGYLHFVRPMPIRAAGGGGESVQPVFHTGNPWLIALFRPAVPVDQEFFPGRWDSRRFQLPPTDLAGLQKMAPFRARVESVGRTQVHKTGVTALQLGLRLESGHFLRIDEPGATEEMFAIAGSLQDFQVHEFPRSWFGAKGRE